MPTPINLADKPKRQAILDAATRIFISHGYSGASMEAIAAAAPVSKPTLYNHFNSKQELFAAVIENQCQTLLGTLNDVQAETSDPKAGLSAIANAFVDLLYSLEALQLYRLIIAEQQQFPELGQWVYRAGGDPILAKMSTYLAELSTQGVITVTDLEMSSHLLLDMLKGELHFRCLLGLQAGVDAATKRRLIDAAVTLFLRGHGYEQ